MKLSPKKIYQHFKKLFRRIYFSVITEVHLINLNIFCQQLTILNKKGRIWTMVAGGGASVIYSDVICDLGGAEELANYGEYSGAPSEQQTYEYAKTILSLMTQEKHPQGKVSNRDISEFLTVKCCQVSFLAN